MTQLRPFGAPPGPRRNPVIWYMILPRRAASDPAFMLVIRSRL